MTPKALQHCQKPLISEEPRQKIEVILASTSQDLVPRISILLIKDSPPETIHRRLMVLMNFLFHEHRGERQSKNRKAETITNMPINIVPMPMN